MLNANNERSVILESCVTSLKTAAKESTDCMAPTIWFSKRNFRFFHVNVKCKSHGLHESVLRLHDTSVGPQ